MNKSTASKTKGVSHVAHQRLVMPPEIQLLLLKEPVRRAAKQLRILADDGDIGISDEGQCTLANMALWLESVLAGDPAYCSPRDIKRAQQWDKKAKRYND